MKYTLLGLIAVLLSFLGFHLGANSQGEDQFLEMHRISDAPATVSMRQNDFALCGQPFYDDVYALTVEIFAEGAENVNLEYYQEQVFALVRSSKEFGDDAEAFVVHIKDIPGQLVDIIFEDPEVLASCANFSVALVGPP
ncbi:MAG: hypothetical protein COB20_00605 [SAR86 cluster bacterium]|uniref:Uncharacterized protein n=1 Tax=SAR86 cluster bacterium TaxID=2030880 RepID=A0A2A4XIM9_9GAMM|nr:MAG: hypothetical protein COB20_00605 [SAR86 cluster bacterium]